MSETDSPFGDLNGDLKITDVRVKTDWFQKGFGIRETGSGTAHPYRECSNAGKCDRKTGKCKCNPGYLGSACDRKGCISSAKDATLCNSHGECLSGKDMKKLSGVTDAAQYDWSDYFYYKCLCYYPWSGTYCEQKQCEFGYDPMRFRTDFIFAYTLDQGGSDVGSSISHYYIFKYRGKTYTSKSVSQHNDICDSDNKLNNDKAKSFKDELYKVLRGFPYFNSFTIELECTSGDISKVTGDDGYGAGRYLTVTLKLDYMNIDSIKDMEFKVLKLDGSTAIKDGVSDTGENKGDIVSNSTYALWLMRYSKRLVKEIQCYTNAAYKQSGANDNMVKSPINLSELCKAAVDDTVGQDSTTQTTDFTVKGQSECSDKGNCNRDIGKCECFQNYYGIACTLRGNT